MSQDLSSDQPGGLVSVHLIELSPDLSCDEAGSPRGFRPLATGAAHLRFHDGTFVGRDFPVGEVQRIRVDLTKLAEVV